MIVPRRTCPTGKVVAIAVEPQCKGKRGTRNTKGDESEAGGARHQASSPLRLHVRLGHLVILEERRRLRSFVVEHGSTDLRVSEVEHPSLFSGAAIEATLRSCSQKCSAEAVERRPRGAWARQ